MLTLPLNLLICSAIGASAAVIARRTLAQYPWYRLPPLWALVALLIVVYVPCGAYVAWQYPDWTMMYLAAPGDLPVPPAALASAYGLLGLAAFFVCRRLIVVGRGVVALAVLAGSLVASALVVVFGREQLSLLGTVATYRTDTAQMRHAVESPLLFVLGGANAALLVSWAAMAWRLWLLGRTAGKGVIEVEPTRVRAEADAASAAKGAVKRASKGS